MDEELCEAEHNKWNLNDDDRKEFMSMERPYDNVNVEKAWNEFKKWNDKKHNWMDRESKEMADNGLVERSIANTKPRKEVPGKIYNAEDPKDAEEFVNRVKKKTN